MTIRFEIPITPEEPRKRFVAEISRDGELTLPGYEEQLEYEEAFAAMGGTESTAQRLDRLWQSPYGQTKAMKEILGLKRKTLRRLAADWVAHVADAYEEAMPMPSDGAVFRAALLQLYRSIEHDIKNGKDQALFKAQHLIGNMDLAVRNMGSSAAHMAHDALFQAAEWKISLGTVRGSAMMARAYSVALDDAELAWDEAHIAEADWQLRRFHDVMAALQQKRPWPPLEATK
jgi:hypothetical protein